MFGLDSIISGGMSLLGGVLAQSATDARQERANEFNAWQADINRQFNREEAEKAREFNSTEAKAGRDFLEMMSNSAYQRGVTDMKAAGINPLLAYSKGGASTPGSPTASGSAASGSAASTSYHKADDIITPAVQSAMALRMQNASVDNMKEQNELLKFQQQQTLATTAKTMAEQNNINADTKVKEAALPKVQEEALSAKYDNSAKKADSDQRNTFAGEWARRIGTSAKDVMSVIPFTGR